MSGYNNSQSLLNLGYIDSNNSSSVILTASSTYTGSFINVTHYAKGCVTVYTDQKGTLYVEHSSDSTNIDMTETYYVQASSGKVHNINMCSKYVRIKYTNGDTDQTVFRLQTIFHKNGGPPTTFGSDEVLNRDHDSLATRPTDFKFEVALGRRSGMTTYNKFGYNNDVDTGSDEIVAAFGGTFFPMTTAATLTIVSDSTADDGDPAGTGANTLVITGVDANYNLQVENVTLNGITNVTTTSTWLGINRVAVSLAGSGYVNAGNITITENGSSTIQAYIPAGEGTTQQLIYHSRANHQVLADWLFLNAQKQSGGGNPKVTFKIWVYSAVSNGKYEVGRFVINTVSDTIIQLSPNQPFVIGEKSCIWVEATTDTNNTIVTGRLSLIEFADEDA